MITLVLYNQPVVQFFKVWVHGPAASLGELVRNAIFKANTLTPQEMGPAITSLNWPFRGALTSLPSDSGAKT